jgi:hypothetical protein
MQMNTKPTKYANEPAEDLRPSPALRTAIFDWVNHQADKPTLSEAICRLVELGLAANGNNIRSEDRQKRRAREMAGETIDDMGDATTTADDRAARKQDLLNGPQEFSRVRVDRPKCRKVNPTI